MHSFLTGLLYVVHIISCLVLIVVVLLHESKGDSLSSVFGGGGSDSAFGVQFGKKVSRFTIGAAVVFLVLAIGLSLWIGKAPTPERIEGVTTPAQPALPEQPAENGE